MQESSQWVRFLTIAHRGASGFAPENTMAAFDKAFEMNTNVIEYDLHMSKDGEVVVIHENDGRYRTRR